MTENHHRRSSCHHWSIMSHCHEYCNLNCLNLTCVLYMSWFTIITYFQVFNFFPYYTNRKVCTSISRSMELIVEWMKLVDQFSFVHHFMGRSLCQSLSVQCHVSQSTKSLFSVEHLSVAQNLFSYSSAAVTFIAESNHIHMDSIVVFCCSIEPPLVRWLMSCHSAIISSDSFMFTIIIIVNQLIINIGESATSYSFLSCATSSNSWPRPSTDTN